MNKSDIRLIAIVVILCLFGYFSMLFFDKAEEKEALVYYKDELVYTVDLTNPEYMSFSVMGDNGLVEIEAENGKIRVFKETSPLNVCSKQGWVESSYTPIVCLPNSIVIKIVDKNSEVDAVVN